MSVINETLDNLKQTKKRGATASLDPSSSAYLEHAEKKVLKSKTDKSFIVPLSLAVLVGVFFVAYRINMPAPTPPIKTKAQVANTDKGTGFWQHATKPTHNQATVQLDTAAQGQYYTAMELLNEGRDAQALVRLKEIVKQYPDFAPAKNAYSMLSER